MDQTRTGLPADGRQRIIISVVEPEVDGGTFPIKRTEGDRVVVEADVFADGSDMLACELLHRRQDASEWNHVVMSFLVNDRWEGSFTVEKMGRYEYTLRAWVDPFRTWVRDMRKRIDADNATHVDVRVGVQLMEDAVKRAGNEQAKRLESWAKQLGDESALETSLELLAGDEADAMVDVMHDCVDHRSVADYDRILPVHVDRPKARFSTWYEVFPRSCSAEPGKHGTFRDCIERLDYVANMGFDVLYLPPIHPIGKVNRKGKNNALVAEPDDVGSPWAIGSAEGGHKAIHPALGTLDDFRALIKAARDRGMEIALDIAFQCAPDHPYVKEHPEWFRRRPDGSIQYAENPPKKYEDIYPFDFETDQWESLWLELRNVFEYWMEQGVRIFRVDNPHTKSFRFWEWLIGGIQREHPDVLFLAEAFTRPKVMKRLAKLGFSQSYTYFAWRNTRWELSEYMKELTQSPCREYMRPNFWPNTPDILTEFLQTGGRPAFVIRFLLAATLTPSYGIYGPAFELCQHEPRHEGSEEYLDSEKYQIREWDLNARHSLRSLISRVNRIRRENPGLQTNEGFRLHPTTNEEIICYSRTSPVNDDVLIIAINLDPYHTHSGWVDLPLEELGLSPHEPFQVHDLLSDAHYIWHGHHNFVELDPHAIPGHILRVQQKVRTEHDFEYYM